MASFNNVQQGKLVKKMAEKLKGVKEIKPPVWSPYVKTGAHNERPPVQEDWWYQRAAAVLRTLSIKGPIGVSKLRTKYGGKKRRGHKPPVFRKSSGNILRKILQQLEAAGLAKKIDKKGDNVHLGRVITTNGVKIMNLSAKEILAEKPIEKKRPEVVETSAEEDQESEDNEEPKQSDEKPQ